MSLICFYAYFGSGRVFVTHYYNTKSEKRSHVLLRFNMKCSYYRFVKKPMLQLCVKCSYIAILDQATCSFFDFVLLIPCSFLCVILKLYSSSY